MAATILRAVVLAGLMGVVTFGQQPCAPPSTSWAGRRVVDLSFGYNDRTVYWDEDGRFPHQRHRAVQTTSRTGAYSCVSRLIYRLYPSTLLV
ncbi:hypothetical protein MRX96_015538 [Rhipicephalus microplus]